ncbi:MAG: hypothetical protein II399_09400 [Lachnospiraceae bacterium]|jgi:hypothetical protein|nr:hypothetical protein [Lachnospiraceae bacterium]
MGYILYFIPLAVILLPFIWLLIVSIADKNTKRIILYSIIILIIALLGGFAIIELVSLLKQFS